MQDTIKSAQEQDIESRLNKSAFITKQALAQLITKGKKDLVDIVIKKQKIIDSYRNTSNLDSEFLESAILNSQLAIAELLKDNGG